MPPSTLAPSISPSPLRTPSVLAPTSGLPPHPPSTPSPVTGKAEAPPAFSSDRAAILHHWASLVLRCGNGAAISKAYSSGVRRQREVMAALAFP
nr:hypothetical protein Iba_chr12aCG9520 [Ipomoea batatas]